MHIPYSFFCQINEESYLAVSVRKVFLNKIADKMIFDEACQVQD